MSPFYLALASLHRVESTCRETEDVTNLIFELCTGNSAYADVTVTLSNVSQTKTNLRLDRECTYCVLCE